MIRPLASGAGDAAPVPDGDRRLARSITATWWYTASAVVFFELAVVAALVGVLAEGDGDRLTIAVAGLGGLAWVAATLVPLARYRHREDAAGLGGWRVLVPPLLLCAAYGVTAGLLSGLWLVLAFAILQPLALLNWPRGVRLRLVLAATVLLIVVWVVDQRSALHPGDATEPATWWVLGFFAVTLPVITVVSLWWWDVLITLDRARAAEARLGATQERLRVATDVHDLQGHHLQVVALQLELAERLMEKDPAAAMEQLRLARSSVDEARQGTRDLALRFRTVPLVDEIANAVDLLRAAGTAAESTVDAGAVDAPASALGPVIRETTTNALRHGGGRWARLSLLRTGTGWRYEIANDAGGDDPAEDGAGLEGIARRVAEAGGEVRFQRGRQEFAVTVDVPEEKP
ncbi:sensor histidine kinase [Microbacterium tumbae]